MNLYDYLSKLEAAHKERAAAEKAEAELTKPIITDLAQMERIYELFLIVLPLISDRPAKDPENRRIFIFICLRLFCPNVFIGKYITYGIRVEMARILGCKRTLISHNQRYLTFFYKKYKSFREKVDTAYSEVLKMYGEK